MINDLSGMDLAILKSMKTSCMRL